MPTTQPAWDTGGNAAVFDDAERTAIQTIWQSVAEDYAPFDVDVTTADPGPGGINRSSSADTTYGSHALITPSVGAHDAICRRLRRRGLHRRLRRGQRHAAAPGGRLRLPPARLGLPAEARQLARRTSPRRSRTRSGTTSACATTATPRRATTAATAPGRRSWASATTARSASGARATTPPPPTRRTTSRSSAASSGRAPTRPRASSSPRPRSRRDGVRRQPDRRRHLRARHLLRHRLGRGEPAGVPGQPRPPAHAPRRPRAGRRDGRPASAQTTPSTASGMGASLTRTLASGTYYALVDGVGNGAWTTGYDDYGSLGAYNLAAIGLRRHARTDADDDLAARHRRGRTVTLTATPSTVLGTLTGEVVFREGDHRRGHDGARHRLARRGPHLRRPGRAHLHGDLRAARHHPPGSASPPTVGHGPDHVDDRADHVGHRTRRRRSTSRSPPTAARPPARSSSATAAASSAPRPSAPGPRRSRSRPSRRANTPTAPRSCPATRRRTPARPRRCAPSRSRPSRRPPT